MRRLLPIASLCAACAAPTPAPVPRVSRPKVLLVSTSDEAAKSEPTAAPVPPPWQHDPRYELVACDGQRPRAAAYTRCSKSTETGLDKLLEQPVLKGLFVQQWAGQRHLLRDAKLYLAERYAGAARLEELRTGVKQVQDAGAIARLRRLTHLELTQVSRDAFLQIIKHKRLRGLHLDHVYGVIDDDMALVASLPKLEAYTVPSPMGDIEPITGAGLRHLSEASKLEALDISGVKTSPQDLVALRKLDKLRHLKVGHELTPEHLNQIAKLKSLETLVLGGAGVSGLDALQRLPQLRSLHWHGAVGVGAEQKLVGLADIETLRELYVGYRALDQQSIDEIGRMTQLEALSIDVLKPVSLMPLRALSKLRELNIGHGTLTPDDLAVVAELTRLEELSLNSVDVPEGLFAELARLPKLRSLSLTRVVPRSRADFDDLPKLRNLEKLALDAAKLTDDEVEHVGRLPKLKVLDLSSNGISGDALRHLRNPKLRYLSVWNTWIDTHACAAFNAASAFDVCTGGDGDDDGSRSDRERSSAPSGNPTASAPFGGR